MSLGGEGGNTPCLRTTFFSRRWAPLLGGVPSAVAGQLGVLNEPKPASAASWHVGSSATISKALQAWLAGK